MDRKCLSKCIVYKAEVEANNNKLTYGASAGEFSIKQSFFLQPIMKALPLFIKDTKHSLSDTLNLPNLPSRCIGSWCAIKCDLPYGRLEV